jgi:hypothetical protein
VSAQAFQNNNPRDIGMVTLKQIQDWLTLFEQKFIPAPKWHQGKQVYEYEKVTVENVAFLKAVRAVQSLRALEVLLEEGLFIDFCTIIRCITDCLNEIYFLLETYPEQSPNVVKFIHHFKESTIDQHLISEAYSIEAKKVHNSKARAISDSGEFGQAQEKIKRIHKSLSGYVHSNYSHVMQIYGGKSRHWKFQLSGVHNEEQKEGYSEFLQEII